MSARAWGAFAAVAVLWGIPCPPEEARRTSLWEQNPCGC